MASAGGRCQAQEKTSIELSYPSVVRFTGPVQLKGAAARGGLWHDGAPAGPVGGP